MMMGRRGERKQRREVEVEMGRQKGVWLNRKLRLRRGFFTSHKKLFRLLLITLSLIAILPPIFFHFKLRRFHQMQLRKCSWLKNPPLVCAHGGDSTKAFPNTMDAYRIALHSQVDCIEIDVSRSSDGVLFALHDRDLQRLSGNSTSKVGYLSTKEAIKHSILLKDSSHLFAVSHELSSNGHISGYQSRLGVRLCSNDPYAMTRIKKQIKELDAIHQLPLEFHDQSIPTIEDALKVVSSSVRQVILDAKVGPPFYEKGLAKDILSIVARTHCKNCLVWAKSDSLARDVMKLSSDVTVGYIVMEDPSTGIRTNLLRMRAAGVVGVYHPLIDDKLVKILHRRSKKVYAWTVDDEVSMQRMLFEGVDAVVTSNPALFQHKMQDSRTKCLEEGFSFS